MTLSECLRTNGVEFKCIFSGITYTWKQENRFYPHLMSPIRVDYMYGTKAVVDKYLLKELWELDTWE